VVGCWEESHKQDNKSFADGKKAADNYEIDSVRMSFTEALSPSANYPLLTQVTKPSRSTRGQHYIIKRGQQGKGSGDGFR